MTFQHYHPEVFDPVNGHWRHCPYPDIPLLCEQALEELDDFTNEEVLRLIEKIEAFNQMLVENLSNAPKDEDFDPEDLRWNIFSGMPDLVDGDNEDLKFQYMAALVLIFISKAAYYHSKQQTVDLVNCISEAYRSYEHIVLFKKNVAPEMAFKKDLTLINKMFASRGGKRSTSVLSQDKPRVLEEWEDIKNKGLSRNKSAALIVERLRLKQQESTIKTWIREYERENKVQSNGST